MSTKKAPSLPHVPGVYLFKNQHNQIIYIGKAKDLYDRVSSYFSSQELIQTSAITCPLCPDGKEKFFNKAYLHSHLTRFHTLSADKAREVAKNMSITEQVVMPVQADSTSQLVPKPVTNFVETSAVTCPLCLDVKEKFFSIYNLNEHLRRFHKLSSNDAKEVAKDIYIIKGPISQPAPEPVTNPEIDMAFHTMLQAMQPTTTTSNLVEPEDIEELSDEEEINSTNDQNVEQEMPLIYLSTEDILAICLKAYRQVHLNTEQLAEILGILQQRYGHLSLQDAITAWMDDTFGKLSSKGYGLKKQ